jgi:outer membrane protein assembly factor BamD
LKSIHSWAIRRANYVIENIPGSSENLRALKILEVSYAKLGYNELLDDVRKVMKTNYPNRELEEISNDRVMVMEFSQEIKA